MSKTLFALSFAVAALFAASTSVFALDQKPKKAKGQKAVHAPGQRLKTLSEKLDLTEEQKEKLKATFEKNAPKVKELRADTTLSKRDKRAKIAEIRKAEAQEIRAVLTPEQKTKWKELRSARVKRAKAGK